MQISAYDDALWRVERVQKAIRLACTILGCTKEQLDELINQAYDHKGELIVGWKHTHTKHQEAAFQTAWELCGEYNVHHSDGVL